MHRGLEPNIVPVNEIYSIVDVYILLMLTTLAQDDNPVVLYNNIYPLVVE